MPGVLVQIGLLIAIFASVFAASQLVLGAIWRNRSKTQAINRRLKMIRAGSSREQLVAQLRKNMPSDFSNLPPFLAHRLTKIQRLLYASALPFSFRALLMAMGAGFLMLLAGLLFGVSGAGFALTGGVLLLAVAVSGSIAFMLPLLAVSFLAQRQRKRVQQQFPVALDIFVRALRSGHPIASAIDLLTREMEDPIGSEFGLLADEVAYGADLLDALQAMADRWDQEDMRMFVVSLSVQNETGGNLAEILENLAQVIRARTSMFMKVRALSSEGRMTGWMLTVLPVLTFVVTFLLNPRFYLDVAGDPIFMIGFPALVLLFATGVFTIRRMVDIKV